MKKTLLLLAALSGLLFQNALAAPIGWYDLTATWRDGSFTGQIYYDSASPFQVTKVNGTLTNSAQTTAINTVWNTLNPDPSAWAFFTNATAADPDTYDAGFYLNVVDAGAGLTLDVLADNSLYDWSHDYAYYNAGQLDASPLWGFNIAQAVDAVTVAEPGSLCTMAAGLALLALTTRRRQPPRSMSIKMS